LLPQGFSFLMDVVGLPPLPPSFFFLLTRGRYKEMKGFPKCPFPLFFSPFPSSFVNAIEKRRAAFGSGPTPFDSAARIFFPPPHLSKLEKIGKGGGFHHSLPSSFFPPSPLFSTENGSWVEGAFPFLAACGDLKHQRSQGPDYASALWLGPTQAPPSPFFPDNQA